MNFTVHVSMETGSSGQRYILLAGKKMYRSVFDVFDDI
jgi:hypothetical protein